ncbi:hypothetical protein A0H81_05396 [Grifola frondosa]|uniref:Uncharacterized protein n=1 Tax=Grifola frondosa TaxID=5627 RepID=A0A1C7MBZ6_GRIFR|nr:hypothetical protein A0H81_05396 [Grifola frondosa]
MVDAPHFRMRKKLTFVDGHAATLLIRLEFVPENHAHLTIFERARDVHFALLFELFDRLRGLLPALLKCTHGEATALTCLALDLGEKGGFISDIVVVLRG